MRPMTEDEFELLHEICGEYWLKFSELVNTTLADPRVPDDLRGLLEMKLQENSSVYGRKD